MNEILQIRVMPRAKRNKVQIQSGGYRVYLTAPPVEGKANKALLEILAEYLNVKRSRLEIIRGERSMNKVIRINKGR
ncbi:MAG: DUF167 domain-containing protein [Candidatus Omnitrophica bacterium]|nr:DUF167 domain-containing protein [Candidatus Omnitrophota bacterium]